MAPNIHFILRIYCKTTSSSFTLCVYYAVYNINVIVKSTYRWRCSVIRYQIFGQDLTHGAKINSPATHRYANLFSNKSFVLIKVPISDKIRNITKNHLKLNFLDFLSFDILSVYSFHVPSYVYSWACVKFSRVKLGRDWIKFKKRCIIPVQVNQL